MGAMTFNAAPRVFHPIAMNTRSQRTLFLSQTRWLTRRSRALGWSGLLLGVVVWMGLPLDAKAMRIKEVASVQGVRTNQLTGFGLVVGLDGTGDQTNNMPYTSQGMTNYLQQLGMTLPADAKMQMKNVAAVLVTAQLPPFAQPGQMIDVTVSSMGNAK